MSSNDALVQLFIKLFQKIIDFLNPKPTEPKQEESPPVLNDLKKGMLEWYELAYKQMTFDLGLEGRIESAARRVLLGRPKYKNVSDKTGVPWRLIGAIHNMESSCDFTGVLHNGERIIGTDKKTTLVPKGLGPFATWESSALDALTREGFTRISKWTLGLELQLAERYNGTGYLRKHPEENSPYLWACTSINDGQGKYIADGQYSETADANKQVGIAAIYKQLELWGEA
jgi:lysozyme family protein